MKYILVLIVIILGCWLWRRSAVAPSARKKSVSLSRTEAMQVMVQCKVCSVHFPYAEAVIDRGMVFCSQAHLQQFPS